MAANRSVVIRFFAPIEANSINALLSVVDQKVKEGVHRITLLLSCPGGTVFHGRKKQPRAGGGVRNFRHQAYRG